MSIDDPKLVQRERLIPACLLLPGHVQRLLCMLPGFLAVSRQTTDLAEPCDPEGTILQRFRADTFADSLFQQRTPVHQYQRIVVGVDYFGFRIKPLDDLVKDRLLLCEDTADMQARLLQAGLDAGVPAPHGNLPPQPVPPHCR